MENGTDINNPIQEKFINEFVSIKANQTPFFNKEIRPFWKSKGYVLTLDEFYQLMHKINLTDDFMYE